MFEDPMQWIVIGVVVVALLMWGPNKIPELAASIGKARREFDKAKKELENPMDALLQSATQPTTAQTPNPQVPNAQPQLSGDETLLKTAREMGIATEGKTKEQISQEIVLKASAKPAAPVASTEALSKP